MSEPRGVMARLGLTLLAFFFPGSAHVRLGRFKRAAALIGSYAFLMIALASLTMLVRDWTFAKWLAFVAIAPMLILLIITAMIMTWRDSRDRRVPVDRYSRWYWVLGAVLAVLLLNLAIPDRDVRPRNFWIPAQSMSPALEVGDRIVVQQRRQSPIEVGTIIVFRAAPEFRVSRIVALGGQRVELRAGRVIVDGRPASVDPTHGAREYRERLPGKAGTHLVRDDGYSDGDTFGPIIIPAGHLFVLGDNRDQSADSRYPSAEYGVGMVPESSVVGIAKFIFWSRHRDRIGRSLEEDT